MRPRPGPEAKYFTAEGHSHGHSRSGNMISTHIRGTLMSFGCCMVTTSVLDAQVISDYPILTLSAASSQA
eukprot:s7922_g2.t1